MKNVHCYERLHFTLLQSILFCAPFKTDFRIRFGSLLFCKGFLNQNCIVVHAQVQTNVLPTKGDDALRPAIHCEPCKRTRFPFVLYSTNLPDVAGASTLGAGDLVKR